jgi:integrase
MSGNSKYSLFKEKGQWVIRRWENGLNKRLPVRQYRHLREDEAELKAFVTRLNAEARTKEAVAFKHAFISPLLLEEYKEQLLAQVPTRKNALCQFKYLNEYFLNYFIGKLNLADPRQWFAVHKSKWATYLLDSKLSASTIRKIVQEANRFMEFLAEKRPDETVAIKFKPLSKARLSTLQAERRLARGHERYVRPKDWGRIKKAIKAAKPEIRAAVTLCYYLGLRRSEALGLIPTDVRREYVKVERQKLSLYGKPSILKGKKNRKTPYWYANPKFVHALIRRLVPMSPDTLGDEFAALETGFHLHDLRATFITNALRDQVVPREVQLAVGHEHLATTMRYARDHRDFGDDIWTPDAA